jgi:hypothetical protein
MHPIASSQSQYIPPFLHTPKDACINVLITVTLTLRQYHMIPLSVVSKQVITPLAQTGCNSFYTNIQPRKQIKVGTYI